VVSALPKAHASDLALSREEAELIGPVIREWMGQGITWSEIRALRSADLEVLDGARTVLCRFRSRQPVPVVELATALAARLMVWMIENGNIGTPERRIFE
jgi:hypothetical protein